MGPGGMGGYGPGWGGGYGMMGRPGFGQGQGYGMGWMMGPGAMGGYGPGMGMGYGMMGPGMMGFGTMGPGMGMGRLGHIWRLGLDEKQAEQAETIWQDLYAKERELWPKIWSAQDRLWGLYYAEHPDAKAVDEAYTQLADLRRQALDDGLQASRHMEDLLTPEQKARLGRSLHGWRMW